MYAFNVVTDEELCFDCGTAPEYAVSYGYAQQHNLMSVLFAAVHGQGLEAFFETAKVRLTYGKHSVCIGDWMAPTDRG